MTRQHRRIGTIFLVALLTWGVVSWFRSAHVPLAPKPFAVEVPVNNQPVERLVEANVKMFAPMVMNRPASQLSTTMAWKPLVKQAVAKQGVRGRRAERLVYGVLGLILVESGGDTYAGAINPDSAVGLTQIMPATGEDLGICGLSDQRTEPGANINACLRHLRRLRNRFGGWDYAKGSYHMGEGHMTQLLEADDPNLVAHRPLGEVLAVPTAAQRSILDHLHDRSWAYYFECEAATRLLTRYEANPAAVTAEVSAMRCSLGWQLAYAWVWYPETEPAVNRWKTLADLESAVQAADLVPIPTESARFGIVCTKEVGALDEEHKEAYRALSAPAAGLLASLGAELRARAGHPVTLCLTEATMPVEYAELRDRSMGATPAVYRTGNAFRIEAPSEADAPILNRLLWQLRRDGDIAWIAKDNQYTIVLNPERAGKYSAVWGQAKPAWIAELDRCGISVPYALSGFNPWPYRLWVFGLWALVAGLLLWAYNRSLKGREKVVEIWAFRSGIMLWPVVLALAMVALTGVAFIGLAYWAADATPPKWFRKNFGCGGSRSPANPRPRRQRCGARYPAHATTGGDWTTWRSRG